MRICKPAILLFSLLLFLAVGCGSTSENGNGAADPGDQAVDPSKTDDEPVIGNLNIGDLVVDLSWEWEFRSFDGYSGEGELRPVAWIVVGKDHYDVKGGASHVTLMSQEIVAAYLFDDSTNRTDHRGSNHWGNSGTPNANHGIRPFLNDKFATSFSSAFRNAVVITELTSAAWDTGEIYTTEDQVFVLCKSEMDRDLRGLHKAGDILPYFDIDDLFKVKELRRAQLRGYSEAYPELKDLNDYWKYYTRTPAPGDSSFVHSVMSDGSYTVGNAYSLSGSGGLRPVINILSSVRVSPEADSDGVYQIVW